MKRCWCGNQFLENYSSEYYKCDKCKSLVSKHDFAADIYNVTEENEDLYGKNYWEISMTRAAGKSNLSEVVDMYLTERAIYWLKYVLQYLKLGGTVAEVGCGLGQLQYVLARLQYNQLAFELSPFICEYIQKELWIQTSCGLFSAESGNYDGILAFDLFEHLTEPEVFLKECSEALNPRGVLCFQTPCYDNELSYEQMKSEKGKFEEQLKAEQHVFLYSRESLQELLKQHGFSYIAFEPAVFGDDYDMFLFASKEPIKKNSSDEIEKYLNSVQNGRLIKALMALYDQNIQKNLESNAIVKEREKLVADMEKLTSLVQEKHTLLEEYQKAAQERLELIEKTGKEKEELQRAADERLAIINELDRDNQRLREENEKLSEEIERRRSVFEKVARKRQQKKGEES